MHILSQWKYNNLEGATYQYVWSMQILYSETLTVLQKTSHHKVCNNNDFTVQTGAFNVSAILTHDNWQLQTTFLFTDAVINDIITLRLNCRLEKFNSVILAKYM